MQEERQALVIAIVVLGTSNQHYAPAIDERDVWPLIDGVYVGAPWTGVPDSVCWNGGIVEDLVDAKGPLP